MARLESRTFADGETRHLLILAEHEHESKLIDKQLGDKIPTRVQGIVTLADGYGEHYIRLMAVANKPDDFWMWQADGEDHLESLTCPVIITAQDLREITAVLAAGRELVRQVVTHVTHGGPKAETAIEWLKRADRVKL